MIKHLKDCSERRILVRLFVVYSLFAYFKNFHRINSVLLDTGVRYEESL